jgi:hypothetical protein
MRAMLTLRTARPHVCSVEGERADATVASGSRVAAERAGDILLDLKHPRARSA